MHIHLVKNNKYLAQIRQNTSIFIDEGVLLSPFFIYIFVLFK